MNFKQFTSDEGWLSILIPADWEEYEDEGEGTYAFFDATSKDWTGNFRITPMRFSKVALSEKGAAEVFISDEIKQNKGAVKLMINNVECAYFKKNVVQDGDEFVVYYWAIGQANVLFLCSFTIDKKTEQTDVNERELARVKNVISSIKVH